MLQVNSHTRYMILIATTQNEKKASAGNITRATRRQDISKRNKAKIKHHSLYTTIRMSTPARVEQRETHGNKQNQQTTSPLNECSPSQTTKSQDNTMLQK